MTMQMASNEKRYRAAPAGDSSLRVSSMAVMLSSRRAQTVQRKAQRRGGCEKGLSVG